MKEMICVAGWYFEPTWVAQLYGVSYRWPVAWVTHREPHECFPFHHHTQLENIGLEFHCYNYFLQNIWQGENVLFCQDDIQCSGAAEPILECIFAQLVDHMTVFRDEEDVQFNGAAHGRMFFCSASFLSFLLEEGGFPFDPSNTGQTLPGEGVDYNKGIDGLKRLVKKGKEKGLRTERGIIIPQLTLARRGNYAYESVGKEGRAEWLQSQTRSSE